MRLVQVKLSNFRCYRDEFVMDVDDLAVLIGQNDSGKSSFFDALDVFFTDKAVPEADDACVHTGDSKVRIACVFEDLPSELVIDVQHPTNLEDEYLLNSAKQLEIAKEFTCSGTGKGKLAGVFARAVHPTADSYDDLLNLTTAKLKQRAKELSVDVSDVDQRINTALRRAIWAHADDVQCEQTDVELKTETAGKIWEQLKKRLPVFALFKSDRPSTDQDAEAQDPMKSAIKEAIKDQEGTLNTIADEVKKEVQEIANRTVEKIREMNPELANQLTPRVKNKNWDSLFSVSLTGDEDIPINKRGSGTRRLVLLNFFRAKAEKEADNKSTGVIYAVEEPETSQHPHNQKMLVEAFEDLAERDGCQVFLTTHTPVLARRLDQHSLRFLAREDGQPVVRYGRHDSTLQEIKDSLGVLPDHGIKAFLGVEGRNDINFLRAISRILNTAGESVPDLGQAEDEGRIVFIPLGGSSMDLWISRLEELDRQEFYVIDRDNEPPKEPAYKKVADRLSQRDKCTVWITEKRELENYIHLDLIRNEYPDYPGTGDDFDDVPHLFAQAVHEKSESDKPWSDIVADLEKVKKKESNAKKRLNREFASKMTPTLLNQTDPKDEIRSWLKAIDQVLDGQ